MAHFCVGNEFSKKIKGHIQLIIIQLLQALKIKCLDCVEFNFCSITGTEGIRDI